MKRISKYIGLLFVSAIAFISCSSVPESLDQNMTEEMFFKNAQESMDQNKYEEALYYYEIYLVRYPENHHKIIGAEYEIALIYFKMKEYEYSRTLFENVLDKYENSPFAVMFPERYKILSEKILEKISIELGEDSEES